MRKFFYFSVVLFLSATTLSAQNAEEAAKVEPAWKLSGVTGLNFSQTSLSNWSGGGESALAGNVYLNGSLIYKEDKWAWENNLALDYGLTRNESLGVRKNTDKIDFASKLGYIQNPKLYYTMLFDFKTQFTEGYNYGAMPKKLISNFMAPAYSTFSIGIDYKPNSKFSLYYSPFALRATFNTDKALDGMFGVDPGKTSKFQMGSYLKTVYTVQLMENVNLVSKADFFTAYDKSFGNVDIDWDVLVTMKINKFLTTSLNTTLRYDDDVAYVDNAGVAHGPRIQFREILGLGVAYNFKN
ncbi:MAG: DUF3078 domain-containing protein [Dysgonamonadaceae bacterium]|jgi:hypothetical protein|nr:DUF3078 domain-containing protein [Dysgonamonadaceae bacterium]